jgi:hypothetical protein
MKVIEIGFCFLEESPFDLNYMHLSAVLWSNTIASSL